LKHMDSAEGLSGGREERRERRLAQHELHKFAGSDRVLNSRKEGRGTRSGPECEKDRSLMVLSARLIAREAQT
jgi:hypothetical protein